MKIYDISQGILASKVFEGDPVPKKTAVSSMSKGDAYNLSAFFMCAHNGTHVDAPYHFINDGRSVDEISLDKFVGPAYVAERPGVISAQAAKDILTSAAACGEECAKRILLKGELTVGADAARVFAEAGCYLLGNESQTVGPVNAPMEVHKILLGKGTVLLEGIRLGEVGEGRYFLCAAPLCLEGADGAPCRALLIDTLDIPRI